MTNITEEVNTVNEIAYDYVLPFFLATGMITNLINILTLRNFINSKTTPLIKRSITTYIYLVWLAVAQLISCASVIPSILTVDNRDKLTFEWAVYVAHFEYSVMNTFTSACVYIIVGLSVDRFVAVCKPHSYKMISRRTMTSIRIAVSFIIPSLLYIPLCFFQSVSKNNDGSYTTIANDHFVKSVFWNFCRIAVEFCHRLIPSIIIVILNLMIILSFRKLKKSATKAKQTSHSISKSGKRSFQKIEAKPKSTEKEENSYQKHKSKSLPIENCTTTMDKSIKEKRTLKQLHRGDLQKASTSKIATMHASKGKTNASKAEGRLISLLLGVIFLFLTTTLPSAYLGITDSFGHQYESLGYEIFRAVANIFEIAGFSFNFFLYFILLPEMRTKLASIFTCFWC